MFHKGKTEYKMEHSKCMYVYLLLYLYYIKYYFLYVPGLFAATGHSCQDTDIFISFDPEFQGARAFAMKEVDWAKPEVE